MRWSSTPRDGLESAVIDEAGQGFWLVGVPPPGGEGGVGPPPDPPQPGKRIVRTAATHLRRTCMSRYFLVSCSINFLASATCGAVGGATATYFSRSALASACLV